MFKFLKTPLSVLLLCGFILSILFLSWHILDIVTKRGYDTCVSNYISYRKDSNVSVSVLENYTDSCKDAYLSVERFSARGMLATSYYEYFRKELYYRYIREVDHKIVPQN